MTAYISDQQITSEDFLGNPRTEQAKGDSGEQNASYGGYEQKPPRTSICRDQVGSYADSWFDAPLLSNVLQDAVQKCVR